jgi:hypothetical protein
MTILDLIKAQCKAQGVANKHAARIEKISGITEEKDGNIAAAVKNFKEHILPAIEEAQKPDPDVQKKAIEEYEKKHNLKNGKPIETKKGDEPDLSNLPPELKTFIEAHTKQISDLTSLVSGVVKSQSESQKLALVREKLKGKMDDEFIDDYIKQVKLDAEDLDAETERVAKSYTEMKQKFINKAVAEGNYQPMSGGVSDKEFDDYVQRNASPKSEFAGVEV